MDTYTVADRLVDRLVETVGELRAAPAGAAEFTLVQAVVPLDDGPVLLATLTRVPGGAQR